MRQPLKQIAYDYVMDRITSGEFAAGMRLSEVAVADEIGISPTPLREAYRQLASEGLLEHRPNAGVFVREFDAREIRELYELREATESFCAAKATQWMNKIQTDRLQGYLDEMMAIAVRVKDRGDGSLRGESAVEFLKHDEAFHALIIKSCDNSAFDKIVRDYRALSKLMTANRYRHTPEQTRKTLEHHAAILDAIRQHNPKDAEQWMKTHIQFSRDATLEQIDDAVAPAAVIPNHETGVRNRQN